MRRSVVALAFVLLVVLPSRASADGIPPNGDFDSSADGWTFKGTSCGWTDADGSPTPGSVVFDENCEVDSPSMNFVNPASVDTVFNYRYTGVEGSLTFIMKVNGAVVDEFHPPLYGGSWSTASSGDFNIDTSAILDLSWTYAGDGQALIDSVHVLGGAPVPTVTPTGTPNVSGTQAAGQVTSSAATPFFNSGTQVAGVGMFAYTVQTPSAVGIEHLAHVEAVSYRWDFCLPTAVTRIFTGMALCMSLPAITISNWTWLGVDMLNYFPAVGSFMLIVMLIRQIQER